VLLVRNANVSRCAHPNLILIAVLDCCKSVIRSQEASKNSRLLQTQIMPTIECPFSLATTHAQDSLCILFYTKQSPQTLPINHFSSFRLIFPFQIPTPQLRAALSMLQLYVTSLALVNGVLAHICRPNTVTSYPRLFFTDYSFTCRWRSCLMWKLA
jgi:hypothetical protein